MSLRQRASAQTFQTTLTVELSGHRGYGASLDAEVEYIKTPDVPMRWPGLNSPGEPAEGGEVEIVEIRPFRIVRGLRGSHKEYSPASQWLLDLIRECIDTDLLTGE